MNKASYLRPARPVCRIALESIRPNPRQPRRTFPEEMIAELADSIRQYGLLSPLTVRRLPHDEFELIAGERRLRALRLLNERFVDVIILNAPCADAALIALIENLQREQLNVFEEAEAYRQILDEFGIKQETLAQRLGKSPSAIANRLRLLKLPLHIRTRLAENALTERHARALLSLESPKAQESALNEAIARKMNVRELEDHIAKMKKPRENARLKMLIRDHRLYVNAVLHTVKDLKSAGISASAKVIEKEDTVDVIVTLPRIPAR